MQQTWLHMHDPHVTMLKRILRYARSTSTPDLHLRASIELTVRWVEDSHESYACCPSVSWRCHARALNTERWRKCDDLAHLALGKYSMSFIAESPKPLAYCDNVSVVYMSSNSVYHKPQAHNTCWARYSFCLERVYIGELATVHVVTMRSLVTTKAIGLISCLLLDNLVLHMRWLCGSFWLDAYMRTASLVGRPRPGPLYALTTFYAYVWLTARQHLNLYAQMQI